MSIDLHWLFHNLVFALINVFQQSSKEEVRLHPFAYFMQFNVYKQKLFTRTKLLFVAFIITFTLHNM